MLSATGPDKQNTWWLGGTDMHAEVQGVHYILSFSLNVVIFLNSASSAAVLVFDLSLCTNTLRGNRERPEYGIYFKIVEKTQYLMNSL